MASSSKPLSHQRILAEAMALADADGVARLTMRSLATRLKVSPMALYRYVDGKEAILDAMVDAVFGMIDLPEIGGDWRQEMERRAFSVRRVLLAHPWALGIIDSRAPVGPATLAHHDAVMGTLRTAGFSLPLTAHAFVALDAYVYGFVLQETSLPFEPDREHHESIQAQAQEAPLEDFPHVREMTLQHFSAEGFRFGDQFPFGLDLVLDGLARALRSEQDASHRL